jgi:hypothetical protein
MQHLQVRKCCLPGFDAPAFGFDGGHRPRCGERRRLGCVQSFVTGLLPACVCRLGLRHVTDVALYLGELFPSSLCCLAQGLAGGVEGCSPRAASSAIGSAPADWLARARRCRWRAPRWRSPRAPGEAFFGLRTLLVAFVARMLFALEAGGRLGIHARRTGEVGGPRLGVALGLVQAIRVRHRRVGLWLVEPRAVGEQRGLGGIEVALRLRLGILRGLPLQRGPR